MSPDRSARRILYPVTAAFVLAWFLFFNWKSVGLYFDNDDVTNLYFAWSRPLTDVYRPVGALFYRAIFALAGFNPVPFRLVCLAIGIGNMGLCWWFVRLISQSDRVAALALLFFAFNSRMMEVWFRTAVVYDLLCFSFYYLAVCLYIDSRRRGFTPAPARAFIILVLFLCALGAKENAIVLPLVLLAYELIFEGAEFTTHRRGIWLIGLLAILNVPYLFVKVHGSNAISSVTGYAPEYTLLHFVRAWARYFSYLLILDRQIRPWIAIGILLLLLGIAFGARCRVLVFAWTVLFLPVLPVAFIPYRGGYVLYVAYPGAALYAAASLVAAQDLVIRFLPRYRTALACVVFTLVAWRWGKLNLHDQRIDPRPWLYESQAQVRQLANQMLALDPVMPRGARVLFLEDPFSTDEWTPYFVVKLLYRDDTLSVDRIKMLDRKPADWRSYQYVFDYRNGRYNRVRP